MFCAGLMFVSVVMREILSRNDIRSINAVNKSALGNLFISRCPLRLRLPTAPPGMLGKDAVNRLLRTLPASDKVEYNRMKVGGVIWHISPRFLHLVFLRRSAGAVKVV